MAFLPSATTITLTAKLTPYGRQQLLANTDSIISHFSLGDSDANYRVTESLDFGDVPASAGNANIDNTLANSVTNNITIRHKVLVNTQGVTTKEVESTSNNITTTEKKVGLTTTLSADTRVFVIDKANYATDPLTNLFSSFNLPITDTQIAQYTSVSDAYGGFSDTALVGFNTNKVLIISINENRFGEKIDGRVLKINMTASGTPYEIFSTYQKQLTSLDIQDAKTSEISPKARMFGDNVVFLFSDEIRKPNNNLFKSWTTGFNTIKPFSVNGKELFNLTTNTGANTYVDKAVGIAFLDKGIIVITEPSIVNNYQITDNVDVTFDSLVNEVSQDITCIVNRGEFSRSTNPTYNLGDPIRVSEIGLHDKYGNLMAIAKVNKQLIIGSNQFMAIGVKITV